MKQKVAIIGATSGIGRELAKQMHQQGYIVGATGRRKERLKSLENELQQDIHTVYMDVTDEENAIQQLDQLVQQMGGLDIVVLNAGVSNYQTEAKGRQAELRLIDVNIRGFANLASYSFSIFERQGHGQLVGISSIASLFGWGLSAPYNASKAFVNTYLQGYRQKANHSRADISVTTILPGFVKSEMTDGKKGMFWLADTDKAVRQIIRAIKKKKNTAYITRRWRLIGWIVKLIPDWVWNRM